LESMRRAFQQKPEQVKVFEELVGPRLRDLQAPVVLDACCGMGDLSYFLSRRYPHAQFVAVDRAEFLQREGARLAKAPNIRFEMADVYDLTRKFGHKTFDIAVCKQTLSWLPRYEPAVLELASVTRSAVFASSLFYDGRIDFETRVREYLTESGCTDYNAYYNVYSFPIFKEFCMGHGAKDVVAFDFNISIDLPRPASLDRMATYTLKLESGQRIQVSGALLMPWKIVRIEF
jgi:ubiquinone/menaquinone biosynthesis C-methylase UbiE